jgi:glycosyltransferase involved in cell wall biosynthesis
MRIAMVSEHASPLAMLGGHDAGGQNVHVASLATALARRGHRVEVYTRRDGLELPDVVPYAPGVEVVHVPAGPPTVIDKDEMWPLMATFGDWLAEQWWAEPPDLVHAHFWMSGSAALRATRAAQATPLPVVQTFHALGSVKRRHQGGHDTSPAARITVERWLASACDRVVATCSDEVAELVGLGAPRERLTVVPCGVDLSAFRPGRGSGHGAAHSTGRGRLRHRLLCLGRLVERKGIDTVIAALADLPDTELVVAGGPPAGEIGVDEDCRRLTRVAADHGVLDRVRLIGGVERAQVPALIRSADVVVCVPWYEPFGITPVEAMACGVPVVASAVGGMLDTVVHGVTGLHVPPRDPQRLARTLTELLADPARLERLGRNGSRRARRYGWDDVAAETETVYRSLIARGTALAPVRRVAGGRS